MPTFIVKPIRDEDFYVAWSTVVDAPTAWGDYEAMHQPGVTIDRLRRADVHGTSMCDPQLASDQQFFGWHDQEFLVHQKPPEGTGAFRRQVSLTCGIFL